ncbi:MAG: hypothetical protein ACREGH_01465 [Minisyncoccia bacterium]
MKKILLAILIIIVLVLAGALWYAYGHGGNMAGISIPFFGSAENNPPANNPGTQSGGNTPLAVGGTSNTSGSQKVFLIAQGPVVAAELMQGAGSTTIARYITGDDGHVLDETLGATGATPGVISQTTIPGVAQALWSDSGSGAILQYLEGPTVKTVHLGFSEGTSSQPQTTVQFLPDDIESIAVSPDGTRVAYLLQMTAGVSGYIAASDGSTAKKLFSLPLSGVALSWPSQNEILAYSKASAGVPGIVFSINAKSGAVSPILYGQGISAITDHAFAHVLYQIADGSAMSDYIETFASGTASPLSGAAAAVLPEQCTTPTTGSSTVLYCAAPLTPPGGNFLDLWHQGLANANDELVSIDLAGNTTTLIANPSSDGGEPSDGIDISVSPDGHYLSFINKDDEKLWGVEL